MGIKEIKDGDARKAIMKAIDDLSWVTNLAVNLLDRAVKLETRVKALETPKRKKKVVV